MRILILSQWFDPEPTFKGMAFARQLARRGHEVEVLTGFPNYPGGKLYPGYRVRFWQREVMQGIPVLRVPLYPSHDLSVVSRIANYSSFAVSAAIGSAFVKRPDVVYVYHPPATVGFPAIVARAFHRAPVVYDIEDLWPDTVAATGMMKSRAVLWLLDAWCHLVYCKADRLVVLSPGFKSALIDRGVPESKIEVIYNWCDEAAVGTGVGRAALGAPGDFTVLFAGTMGLAQGLDAVLDAARICARSVPKARFVFVGGGVDRERLERRAREMRLTNVIFLARRPIDLMGPTFRGADACLIHLKDDPLFRITIPSKTQTYLAAGRPVVAAVRGDAADLITRAHAGVLAEPESPTSIAEAVGRLEQMPADQREALGKAGKAFYDRELSLHVAVKKFEALFEAVVDKARSN